MRPRSDWRQCDWCWRWRCSECFWRPLPHQMVDVAGKYVGADAGRGDSEPCGDYFAGARSLMGVASVGKRPRLVIGGRGNVLLRLFRA